MWHILMRPNNIRIIETFPIIGSTNIQKLYLYVHVYVYMYIQPDSPERRITECARLTNRRIIQIVLYIQWNLS